MFKFLLALVVVSTAGFFGWRHFFSKPDESAEKMLAEVVVDDQCAARQLAELADRHPQASEKALKGRILQVSGVLTQAVVKGLESSDLILELQGTSGRKINFTSDFKKYTRMMGGFEKSQFVFQKFGNEIVLFPANKTRAKSEDESNGMTIPGEEQFKPRVIYREGDTVVLRGMFQHVGSRDVSMRLTDAP